MSGHGSTVDFKLDMYNLNEMKSISVRDLRHHWPEAERMLLSEREIIITRDAKPIAKLIPWNGKRARSRRFKLATHQKWQKDVFGTGKQLQVVDAALDRDRTDR